MEAMVSAPRRDLMNAIVLIREETRFARRSEVSATAVRRSGAPFSPTSLESRLGRSAAQSFAEKLHRLGLLTGAAAGNDTR